MASMAKWLKLNDYLGPSMQKLIIGLITLTETKDDNENNTILEHPSTERLD